MDINIAPFISGIISGIVVAVLNYYFSRKKTAKEVEKLSLENKKLELEIGKIQNEIHNLNSRIIASVNTQAGNAINLEEETLILPEATITRK